MIESVKWIRCLVLLILSVLPSYDGPLDFDDFIVYGPEGAPVESAGKLIATWSQIKDVY
jgi:hypothetical protein